jgi:hypothetical protein
MQMKKKSTVAVVLLSLTLSFGSFYHFFENAVSRLWKSNSSQNIDAGSGADGNGGR